MALWISATCNNLTLFWSALWSDLQQWRPLSPFWTCSLWTSWCSPCCSSWDRRGRWGRRPKGRCTAAMTGRRAGNTPAGRAGPRGTSDWLPADTRYGEQHFSTKSPEVWPFSYSLFIIRCPAHLFKVLISKWWYIITVYSAYSTLQYFISKLFNCYNNIYFLFCNLLKPHCLLHNCMYLSIFDVALSEESWDFHFQKPFNPLKCTASYLIKKPKLVCLTFSLDLQKLCSDIHFQKDIATPPTPNQKHHF